ncbi:MAG TPA: RNA 2',3'-cyclic phosphodiesterase [Thermoanaerobaculia bacterium]|nr:RNA 2',3'-cyclic phosphodiesterase [Thermoanaerobaculia bacterium]
MRLFLAIPIPDPLRDGLARRAAAVRADLPRATWVRPGAMHLTLHFFGERELARAEEIAAALTAPIAAHRELSLHLARAGAFPRARPRVVWIGLHESPTLDTLHRSVRETLDRLGEPLDERAFHAHLTLARCKERFRREHQARLDEAFADLEGIEMPVREVVLYESALDPRGARHAPVARLPLGDPNA